MRAHQGGDPAAFLAPGLAAKLDGVRLDREGVVAAIGRRPTGALVEIVGQLDRDGEVAIIWRLVKDGRAVLEMASRGRAGSDGLLVSLAERTTGP